MKNKLIITITIIALIVIGILIFYNPFEKSNLENNTNNSKDKKDINFIELKKGSYNTITEKQERIVKSSAEWADLWTEMFPTEMIASAINFDERMVIAVFMGEKNTGGYSIMIDNIVEKDTYPGIGCAVIQVLTQPYYIVELPKSDKEIKFVYGRETSNCG